MNKTRLALHALLLLTISCAPILCKRAKAAETCSTLLTSRCESCHYLTRVCEKVADNKGKWSWKRTVKNMVRQGAKLNQAEQDIMVACLSEPAPEVKELCGRN